MSGENGRLVWVDLEMTGLDPETCVIVEIAVLVTDGDLHVIAEGPQLVIHQPEEELAKMAPIVQEMHARSGLTDQIRQSTTTLAEAEAQVLSFLVQHCAAKSAPLCGNSIWKDKQFLERYMPRVMEHLHYRIVDVSTLKELAARWYPPSMHMPKKGEKHRALDDIKESIAELSFYRKTLFVPRPG
jgi:oligoribonuclease